MHAVVARPRPVCLSGARDRHHHRDAPGAPNAHPRNVTRTPSPRIGVSTSPPTLAELKRFGHLVLQNVGGNRFGMNRLNRAAVDFHAKLPRGTFWQFFLYLSNEVFELSERQHRRLLANPNIYRHISYADPTGEQAAHNADRRTTA